jgi:hypothetical protein
MKKAVKLTAFNLFIAQETATFEVSARLSF